MPHFVINRIGTCWLPWKRNRKSLAFLSSATGTTCDLRSIDRFIFKTHGSSIHSDWYLPNAAASLSPAGTSSTFNVAGKRQVAFSLKLTGSMISG